MKNTQTRNAIVVTERSVHVYVRRVTEKLFNKRFEK